METPAHPTAPASPASAPLVPIASAPFVDLADILTAVSDQTRWRIFKELLTVGEPLGVLDLSKSLGVPATNISKHVNTLRRFGILRRGRGNLYSIPAGFLVPNQPLALDLGAVLIRLDRLDAAE